MTRRARLTGVDEDAALQDEGKRAAALSTAVQHQLRVRRRQLLESATRHLRHPNRQGVTSRSSSSSGGCSSGEKRMSSRCRRDT